MIKYIRITQQGPNNTSHPKYKDMFCARLGEGCQVFRVVEEDDNRGSHGTYITEDGYCLHRHCVKEIRYEEYCEQKGISPVFIPLIFN